VVGADGDELLAGQADHFLVGEGERTARDPVVSGTAERVAIHLPQQDRFAEPGGLPASLPEVGPPGDGGPCVLVGGGPDDRPQAGHLHGGGGGGGHRGGGGQGQ